MSTSTTSIKLPALFGVSMIAAYAIKKSIASNKNKDCEQDGASSSDSGISVTLPTWAKCYMEEHQKSEYDYQTEEDMAKVAIELASKNVSEGTGGPFGCAIFERDVSTGNTKLFSVGVNRVVPLSNSTLHAEMVAIQFAQQKLNTFSMATACCTVVEEEKDASVPKKEYILCTSCEPCAMCLGGILWSGVSEIVCCAAKNDAEAIGFNEGPVFEESYNHLRKAGIGVKKRVLHEEGAQVLQDYAKVGVIYNNGL